MRTALSRETVQSKKPATAATQEWHTRHVDRYGKALFWSLWVRAWGEQYPVEVQPYSSCTRELLRQVVNETALSPGQALVELGCGTGGVGLWLAAEMSIRLVGVDFSPRALEIATMRIPDWPLAHRAEFVCGEFAGTGLAAGSIDAVVSVDALPFAPDIDAALHETARVLRPGGRLVFTNRGAPPQGENAHVPGPVWMDGLERNGFDLLRVIDRPGVSRLWRKVYDQWVEYEDALRAELKDETVDGLLAEARTVGPKLFDGRPWLIVTAVKA